MARERSVVDDEEDILELVRYNLSKERYRVSCALSGEIALEKAREESPDLILLDLMLPGLDGLTVCRQLKRYRLTSNTPIVMLTAKGEEADIVVGLEWTDDYIVKPFSPRISGRPGLRLSLGGGNMTMLKMRQLGITISVYVRPAMKEPLKGVPITLTTTEFRILHFLARRPGWVFSRDKIINAVKGEDYAVTDRSVDVQIVGLRKKLGSTGECIQTVRGVGYKFKES